MSRFRPLRAHRARPIGLALLTLLALGLLAVAAIERYLDTTTAGTIYRDLAAVPTRQVAIVFGAQALPSGQPSNALAYRLDGAIALYQAGKVRRLLLTGERSLGYDEPGAMRDYALARGVPDSAIVRDDAGLRTYDSCYRARTLFAIGPDEAILVTQEYHLPRALYTCAGLGLRAIGFVAQPFRGPRAVAAERREHPARWLAWWEITVARPTPRDDR